MGIRVRIGANDYEAESYSVREESTPTSSEDSSGSVGTLDFSFKGVKDPLLLEGLTVSLLDTRRGTTIGYVSSVTENDRGSASVTCLSRLGRLNIYDVQAQPFSGTLQDAYRYYLNLAEQTTDILVDPSIASRPVVFPGWNGELWFHLKQMAAAQDCEIALVSNVILLRPLRSREAIDYRNISRSRSHGGTQLARAVEVYSYNNRPITNELVYPPGGWVPEVEVIAVSAGQTVVRNIDLSASVSYIEQPIMGTFVDQSYITSSVYTIVGDDGIPVQPQQWRDFGGSLEVAINPDTVSLSVTVIAPVGIMSSKAEPISTFSVALGSDLTGNRYSTLRIIGTGVAFDRQVQRVRTCVPDQLTGTDVGITIDNPFLSTIDQAYGAGVKAARWYAGESMSLDGAVTSINRLGDSGAANYPKYSFDQSQWAGKTYAQVQTANAASTYQSIEDAYYAITRDDFDNQVFGNAGGVRVWDETSKRWYRNRSSQITTSDVTIQCDDDLTHFDVDGKYEYVTYATEKALFAGRTYSQRDRLGLYEG